jgi:peroxiredoxin
VTVLQRCLVWCGAGALAALGSPALGESPSLTADQLARLDLAGYARSTVPPEFSLRTPGGQVVSPAQLRGKVVILNFWATWCRECRTEMPGFEALHRHFEPRGLAVVGVDSREGATTVQRYARELGLTFPLVLDPDGTVTARYGVIGLPTTFVIGRDGRAVALAIGAREWASTAAREIVETLLGDPAGGAGLRGTRR